MCGHAAVLVAPIAVAENAQPIVLLLAGAPLSLAAGVITTRRAMGWLPLPAAAVLVVFVYATAADGDSGPLDPLLLGAFFVAAAGGAVLIGHGLAKMLHTDRAEGGVRQR